jgi:hypothetical protein
MLEPSSLIKVMHNASRKDVEQYCTVAADAKENLIIGIGAIGELMFWAANGDDNIDGNAAGCMRGIGLMLQTTASLITGIDAAHADLEFAKRNQVGKP